MREGEFEYTDRFDFKRALGNVFIAQWRSAKGLKTGLIIIFI